MEYNFRETEKKWQAVWAKEKPFKADNHSEKPKYYVLDMFPYPSGAGLHVGHPLGYIASDIYSRYKRLKGFNVLHPMGFDAFGLPAEQYAIQTGQHPAITTEQNIKRYREQLDNMGFSFDWDREVRTSDPDFYKWTQWIFLKLFNSWYNPETNKAESIEKLIKKLESGNWNSLNEKEKSDELMNYRLAFLSEAYVNWCPALGTVLANDEVKDGVSERGGYPVERKLMKQWSLRITAYAQRLLDDLETIDWPESLKEQQRNWIGRSEGSSAEFKIQNSKFKIEVFTTRPDTIYGATFLTLAPEHELVEQITTLDRKEEVAKYVTEAKNRSERERMTEVKRITGVFTGAYAIHPFTNKNIPIWIGDYVLAGYGTGAVMAVPAHDERDFAFATHFGLPKPQVIQPDSEWDFSKESYDEKEGVCINSDFINGLQVKDAIKKIISEIEKRGLGKGKINYRLRDAVFGRQRYWGEPIPIYYKDDIPYPVDEKDLPIRLPEVDKYLPTEDGEPPLARAIGWKYKDEYEYEKTTMPGWAGSSWYFLRYMDANNKNAFVSKEALNYWQDIDLYIGGAEHATGHLLYFRFWTKFLYDLGYISIKEPAKKLINQGMIQGVSEKINSRVILVRGLGESRLQITEELGLLTGITPSFGLIDRQINDYITSNNILLSEQQSISIFISKEIAEKSNSEKDLIQFNVPIEFVDGSILDIEKYIQWKQNKGLCFFISEDGVLVVNGQTISGNIIEFKVAQEVEKMSKSKYNVVNPDNIIEQHGADALRLYEMFLGPLELSKPWNTNGISGTSNFIRKLWRLFHSKEQEFFITDEEPNRKELKSLHKLIKKVTEDIERFSFNTSVSNFMICVNELTDLKCNKRSILEPLVILVSPYAPHVAEELWQKLGHDKSVTFATWPEHKEEFLEEDTFAYPISVNGKTKINLSLSLALNKEQIEDEVLKSEEVKRFLGGQSPKKVIVVPGRIVNIVL